MSEEFASVVDHLGELALAYVLSIEPESVPSINHAGASGLSASQVEVLDELYRLDREAVAFMASARQAPERWSSILSTPVGPGSPSWGNAARVRTGGEVPDMPLMTTPIEAELARLVWDAYPALLMRDPEPGEPFGYRGVPLSLYQNPASERFQDAVMADAVLSAVYTEDYGTGPTGYISRSTGHGGTQQLVQLADTLILSGWRASRLLHGDPTFDQVLAQAITGLRMLKDSLGGSPVSTRLLIGIAGVKLPVGVTSIELGWATIRAAERHHEDFARLTTYPLSVAGVAPSALGMEPRLAGDLIIDTPLAYATKSGHGSFGESPFAHVERIVEDVRLGLLLSTPEKRHTSVMTWSTIIDPLSFGDSATRSEVDTRSIYPQTISPEEAEGWSTWATRVHEMRTPTVAVAIRRMLATVDPRRSGEDVLVDAVIVWENLFGARAETLLRVTSSLAWMLGASPEDRIEKQRAFKKIYGMRSNVVHGAAQTDVDKIYEAANDAVLVSVNALAALFSSHTHLLAIGSSEERSLRMLHDGALGASLAAGAPG